MYNGQLEMSFGNRGWRSVPRRQRRLNQARWWFARMRQVVETATEWEPVPMRPPEQIWFVSTSGGGAEAGPAETVRQDQREICE